MFTKCPFVRFDLMGAVSSNRSCSILFTYDNNMSLIDSEVLNISNQFEIPFVVVS